jgi:hypothetical protein
MGFWAAAALGALIALILAVGGELIGVWRAARAERRERARRLR